MIFTGKKKEYISQLVNENNVIGALAIDQRGALKKMKLQKVRLVNLKKLFLQN